MPQYVSDFTAILPYFDQNDYWGPNTRLNTGMDTGTPVAITYKFQDSDHLTSKWDMPYDYNVDEVVVLNGTQKNVIRDSLDYFETQTGVIFIEVDANQDAMFEFNGAYGPLDVGIAAFADLAYSTETSVSLSTLTFDIDALAPFSGGFSIETINHEIAHSLGLSHPHEGSIRLKSSYDNNQQTVMTYNWGSSPNTGIGVLDNQALDFLYGDKLGNSAPSVAYRGGDDIRFSFGGGDDVLVGTNLNNKMLGRGGDDSFLGRQGDDILLGHAGEDTLEGGAGSDLLKGGKHNDILTDFAGSDNVLKGQAGSDYLESSGTYDRLDGGGGSDYIEASGAYVDMIGGNGADEFVYTGTMGASVNGGKGADTFTLDSYYAYNLYLDMGDGDDTSYLDGATTTYYIAANAKGDHDVIDGWASYASDFEFDSSTGWSLANSSRTAIDTDGDFYTDSVRLQWGSGSDLYTLDLYDVTLYEFESAYYYYI